MIAGRNYEDYQPLTWVGRFPVYLTTLLVALHVAAMIGVAVCLGVAGGGAPFQNPLLAPLVFSSERIFRNFSVWEFVTYAFVNQPSIWFAVEMYFLFVFGREVERFLGRISFGWLYLSLVLVAPVALAALQVFGIPSVYFGSGAIHFAIFIAFVVIYPGAEMLFGLQARWIALILLGIYSLQYLSGQAWIPLGVLWMECGCAYGMLRSGGVAGFKLPPFLADLRGAGNRVRRTGKRAKAEEVTNADPFESIDPLLEKISKHGIGSLNRRERERLERARTALIEKEKHHG